MRVLRCVLVAVVLGLAPGGFWPVDAMARQTMSFSAGDHARVRAGHAVRRGHAGRARGKARRAIRGRPHAAAHHAAPRGRRTSGGSDEGDAAKAVPGKGFTLENGILTYPAPARFQPRNLRPR